MSAGQEIYFDNISTHSLTRRLTIVVEEQEFAESISTHSLTRRLTKEC